jgi:hypothetical protein
VVYLRAGSGEGEGTGEGEGEGTGEGEGEGTGEGEGEGTGEGTGTARIITICLPISTVMGTRMSILCWMILSCNFLASTIRLSAKLEAILKSIKRVVHTKKKMVTIYKSSMENKMDINFAIRLFSSKSKMRGNRGISGSN